MKVKCVFFIFSLKGGGAERTVVNIINNLDKTKFEITLILGSNNNNEYMHLISDDIKIKKLNATKLRNCFFKLMKTIHLEKPDIMFSTLVDNNIMLLTTKLLGRIKAPAIVREANNRTESKQVSIVNRLLTYMLYNLCASKVVALSNGVKDDLINNFCILENKINVIYNPVEVLKIKELSKEVLTEFDITGDFKVIIAIGRLVEQKDYYTLLKSFSQVLESERAILLILGKGPMEKQLIDLTVSLGVNNHVVFLGFKRNPYKYLKRADIFILSSKWEGFGHVIVEAMAVGVPVISTNCKSGPSEIIGNNEFGLLVPVQSPDILAEKIIFLLKSKKKREDFVVKGLRRAEHFEAKKIVLEYENLFAEVTKKD
ncbi:glycosyltransferase [Paenibacillus sp. IB182496]|uniref:Glycosyltransferase n=1 Tax=Paenibacillus sabuli TaxID=2772509 RepID=A0A927BVF4_9BACL|nr:glycosyltransferase [Paenibacillus sabuli]MBD2847556.1 glycosyltransferase [Paenibacillus sabuli]